MALFRKKDGGRLVTIDTNVPTRMRPALLSLEKILYFLFHFMNPKFTRVT